MNRDTAAGNWQQLSGKIKQKWGKLTDDDLTRAEGDKEYLVGKLHEQYGLARDKAEDELDSLGYRKNQGSGGRMDAADRGGNLERDDLAGSREQGGRVSEGHATKRTGSGESVDEDIRAAGYGDQDQQEANRAGDRGSSRQLEGQGRNSRGQFTEAEEGDAAMEAAGTSQQRQGKQAGGSNSPRGAATDKEAQRRGGQNSRGDQGGSRS